jgi:hypothetical protein
MMHLGVNSNKLCRHNLGNQSFIRVNMTRQDNSEIDVRLIVGKIINWAELTQDGVHLMQEDFICLIRERYSCISFQDYNSACDIVWV